MAGRQTVSVVISSSMFDLRSLSMPVSFKKRAKRRLQPSSLHSFSSAPPPASKSRGLGQIIHEKHITPSTSPIIPIESTSSRFCAASRQWPARSPELSVGVGHLNPADIRLTTTRFGSSSSSGIVNTGARTDDDWYIKKSLICCACKSIVSTRVAPAVTIKFATSFADGKRG